MSHRVDGGRRRRRGRLLAGSLAATVLAVMPWSTARADPAGPTDYRSEIVAVEPPTPTITLGIVGGDSFVELTVAPGTEVFVLGYQGEDNLWFRPDGTVWENRNSPSTYLNEDRLGGGEIPANATADAEPDWRQVAADGNYAWHDHRAHWMQEARPFGLGPGDQILESVIPLVVDGTDVEVTVISTWEPAPSPAAAIAGVVGGIALGVAAWFLRRRAPLAGLAATVPVIAVALVAGVWQFRSLPPETGPRLVWWVLPAVALASVVVGSVVAARRAAGPATTFAADAALLVVGVELAVWGFVKRDGLSAAIVPTGAPGVFDRFATALALAGGIGFALVALAVLFAPVSGSRVPTGSRLPAHP
jgi:hypothetical protein